MTISEFLQRMKTLSQTRKDIIFYPYEDGEKLYSRFLKKCFVCDDEELQVVTKGWLREIYLNTNGLDLCGFSIVPFNNYFNEKAEGYDTFRNAWFFGNGNPDEIINTDFHAFMTDGNIIIGFCTELMDKNGDHFISIAIRKYKFIADLIPIASSIYSLLDYIIEQLDTGMPLLFSSNPENWRERDKELDEKYRNGNIHKYKMRHVWNYDSLLYRQNSRNE